jgi:hypothetical protein
MLRNDNSGTNMPSLYEGDAPVKIRLHGPKLTIIGKTSTPLASEGTGSVGDMSESQQSQYLGLILIPVLVYVAGRLCERGLIWIYERLHGSLYFDHRLEGDVAFLTIRSRTTTFLDELAIYLKDRRIDLLEIVRRSSSMDEQQRIQLSPADRINLEFIVQRDGDKKMFVHSYLGPKQTLSEQDLPTDQDTVQGFVRETRMVVETSERSYERVLFADP